MVPCSAVYNVAVKGLIVVGHVAAILPVARFVWWQDVQYVVASYGT